MWVVHFCNTNNFIYNFSLNFILPFHYKPVPQILTEWSPLHTMVWTFFTSPVRLPSQIQTFCTLLFIIKWYLSNMVFSSPRRNKWNQHADSCLLWQLHSWNNWVIYYLAIVSAIYEILVTFYMPRAFKSCFCASTLSKWNNQWSSKGISNSVHQQQIIIHLLHTVYQQSCTFVA